MQTLKTTSLMTTLLAALVIAPLAVASSVTPAGEQAATPALTMLVPRVVQQDGALLMEYRPAKDQERPSLSVRNGKILVGVEGPLAQAADPMALGKGLLADRKPVFCSSADWTKDGQPDLVCQYELSVDDVDTLLRPGSEASATQASVTLPVPALAAAR